MIYFIIFLFFVPFVFLYEYKFDNNVKLIFTSISCCLLVFLSGLRGSVDGDYESYLDIYQKVTLHYNEYSSIVEPGYIVINQIAFNIGLGFNFVIFSMAFFTIFPKIVFFHNISPNFALSVLIFFCTSFFIFDFTQIRQALSIGIFMYSLKFIIDKNIYMYFFFIILATLFHYSSIILLPGYFLFNKTFNNKLLYLLVFFCSVISLLQIKINLFDMFIDNAELTDNVSGKLNIYQQSELYSFISIKQILFGFLFIHIKNSSFLKNKYLNLLVNLYVFGIFVATALNQISEIAFRIKWYFFWTECILVVLLIAHISKNNLVFKNFLNTFFVIYYFIILIILLDNLSNNGFFIYPYKFFFES
jgi:hypothetical protein